MRTILFICLLISNLSFSQNNKKFSFELKGNTFTGIGDNFIADGTKTFTGFGVEFSALIYKNYGLGMEFNKGYSEVSDVSVFGDLHSPQLSMFDFYALYQYHLNQKLSFEGNIGGGFMQLTSYSNYRTENFIENGGNFFFGGKVLYNLTKNGNLVLVGGPRLYFINTHTELNDIKIEKYYSNATLLNFSLGLRICF